jgi:hemoglobin
MHTLRHWTLAALAVVAAAGGLPAAAQPGPPPALSASPPPADTALYAAFGGRTGIATLMDDFVGRLKADARTASHFEKTNRAELARSLTDQVCMLTGGPCRYEGPTMKKAHADLEIGRRDFNALVEVLQDSMDARGVAFRAQNRLLALLAPMHRDVETQP